MSESVKTVSARVPETTYRMLERIASEKGRCLSTEVQVACSTHVLIEQLAKGEDPRFAENEKKRVMTFAESLVHFCSREFRCRELCCDNCPLYVESGTGMACLIDNLRFIVPSVEKRLKEIGEINE